MNAFAQLDRQQLYADAVCNMANIFFGQNLLQACDHNVHFTELQLANSITSQCVGCTHALDLSACIK